MSANPGALKRKHSGKTIKELFTTQSKPNAAAVVPLSPTKKRTRRESSPVASTEVVTPPGPTSNMSTADMYHFPSKRADIPSSADVVDITSSPDNSPAKANGQRNGMRKAAPNMHANGGPKRLLVKNFKPIRKVDPKVFLDQTWQKIEKALDTIFAQGAIDFSLEELYRGVENVCRQGMAKDVKERLVAKCKEYVGGSLKAKVKESLGRGSVEVLRATLQAWAVWNEQVVSYHGMLERTLPLIPHRNIWTGSFATSTAHICSHATSPCETSPWTSSAPTSSHTQSSTRALWTALAISSPPIEPELT
jgi:cullin-4